MSNIIKDKANNSNVEVKKVIEDGRQKVLSTINSLMLITNWSSGKLIVKEQGDNLYSPRRR